MMQPGTYRDIDTTDPKNFVRITCNAGISGTYYQACLRVRRTDNISQHICSVMPEGVITYPSELELLTNLYKTFDDMHREFPDWPLLLEE